MHLSLFEIVLEKLRAIAVYNYSLKDIVIKLFTQLTYPSMYLKFSKKVRRVGMRPSHACNLAQISMRRSMLNAPNISPVFSLRNRVIVSDVDLPGALSSNAFTLTRSTFCIPRLSCRNRPAQNILTWSR